MNINANELLLLNKKIRFGEGNGANPASAQSTVVTAPSNETAPQAGLNALMFQGLNNVSANPALAASLNVMNEAAPEQTEEKSANEYVAPFKSNLAFQGKASKIKTAALAAMMGLMTLGTTTALTSCDTNVTQSVEIDLEAIMSVITEMKTLLSEMKEQQEITNSQMQQMNAYMLELLEEVKNGNISEAQFYQKMFDYMVVNQTNQELIIAQLEANGMTQQETNTLIQNLIAQVESGQITAQEAWTKIQSLLGDIKGLLNQAIETFTAYYDQMLAKQDELIATNKQGFDEIIKNGNITNSTLSTMTEQNNSLISLNEQQVEALNNIQSAIEKANLDSNANFETVVSTLNVNKSELIAVLTKLGYTQAEITKMTADEIKSAIEENTAVTEGSNYLLSVITNQLSILPQLLKEGKITNAQLSQMKSQMTSLYNEVKNGNLTSEEFYKKAVEYMTSSTANQQTTIALLVENGKTEAEANKLLQQLIDKTNSGSISYEEAFNEIKTLLGDINNTIKDIDATLKTLLNTFNSYYADYKADRAKAFKMMGSLIKENKIQTSVLLSMENTQQEMAENIKGIKSNTETLITIVSDDSKYNELISTIKNSSSIDYDKFEEMFKLMNMNISEALNMSQSELLQAIKDFQKTYVEVEQKQTEELQTINGKLDDLQYFNNLDKTEIINAINKVTTAVNNGSDDVSDELTAVVNAINKLQATVDAIYSSIGTAASNFDTYFQKWETKFNTALGDLENIDSKLSTIISNQKVAQSYLSGLQKKADEIKEAIEKLQNAAGSGVDYDKLEEMWKEHDAANYEKYSKLIKDLGIDPTKFDDIEDLLKSIDSKMSYIQENSDILTKILDKLNGLDLTNEQLTKIKTLLENFKCNCECGKSNEGVLTDLDKIIG